MKKKFVIVISLILIILLNFCGKDKSPSIIEEIRFNVDSTLLNEKFILKDVNISINPPKNWKAIDSDSIKMLTKSLKFQGKHSTIILDPKNIYIDSITQSIMIISLVNSEINNEKKDLISQYIKEIKNNTAGSKIMINEFMKDSFHITQFLIQNIDYINFKLVVYYKKSVIQLDYFIPPKEYNTEIAKTIESSIGSMNVFNNKLKSEDL